MQDFSLNDWLTFAKVVESKSFSQAAAELDISPSVISKRISQLEKSLCVRLFQRSTRSLVLTEAGQLFYEHCKRIREEVDIAKVTVTENQKTPQGLLRIHSPMSFGQRYLTNAIADFITKHPDIKVELLLSDETPNLIENSIDVALSIKELPDSNLIAKKIANRSIGIYASPLYIKKFGKPAHPYDLKQFNCLLYHRHTRKRLWQFIDKDQQHYDIEVTGNFSVNNNEALIKAAVSGLGIAKVPSFMVTQEVKDKKLVRLLEKYCYHNIGIYTVYAHKSFVPAKIKLFIDFLSKRFSSSKFWQN